LPNAFELYGADFLVHGPVTEGSSTGLSLQVKLLELNAEPAIELTGPRLSWILEDLFHAIGKVCIVPFFAQALGEHQDSLDECRVGQNLYGLRKCLQGQISKYVP
jgi:tubulin---tyrosine ligase